MWASYVIHFMVMTFLSTLLIKINEHYCHHSHFYYILLGAWSWLAPPLVNLLLLVVFRTHSTFTFMAEKLALHFLGVYVATFLAVLRCPCQHCRMWVSVTHDTVTLSHNLPPLQSTLHLVTFPCPQLLTRLAVSLNSYTSQTWDETQDNQSPRSPGLPAC